jgi:hypothetical protein
MEWKWLQLNNVSTCQKKIKKKTPGYNNVRNLPPTDLVLLPHKTPTIKHRKVILWSNNEDIMEARRKINADVTDDLLFYPAAAPLSDNVSVIRLIIHYNTSNVPPPRTPPPQLVARYEQQWHMSNICQRKEISSISISKVTPSRLTRSCAGSHLKGKEIR